MVVTTESTSTPTTVDEALVATRTKREIYTVMSGLLIAILLAMLDNLIVGTAMPTIVGDLGGLAHLSWVVTAYALATAVSTPVWAKLGDLYGRKGVFMAAITVFLIGSALSGLSQNMDQLIGFRGIQGLGAGGLMVSAMAIIGDLVPPRERARYQGMLAAVMPLAFIGGPLLGGYLTDHLSWRWAFYVNLPLGVLALVVTGLTMHLPGRRPGRVYIDGWGAGLLGAGVGALTLLASWGGSQYPWRSWQIIALGGLTVAALTVFVLVQRRLERDCSEPILALSMFASRNFTAATTLIFLVGLSMFGAVTFLPQFQQNVQGASATSSGLLLLPLMGGMLVTAVSGGLLITRTGRYKAMLVGGSTLMATGLGLLASMGVHTSQSTTSLYMIVLGVGMGMLMQTTMLVMQNSVSQHNLGAASGAATMFQTIGGSLGVSLMGTLFAKRLSSSLQAIPGGRGSGHLSGSSQLTPAMLDKLPEPVRIVFQQAIASGVGQVFLWGAGFAVLAIIASLTIREVPLRGETPTDPSAPPTVPAGVERPPVRSRRRNAGGRHRKR
jgi:EmrB/QacA subfamily drug resistance transporter